ncbi:hypothetical protein KIN20_034752 [Parelaphostrongylus tenuis]|uniref:Uncharacterized protein n=1 Tax=Parelaphostrongylus tenuis TaxID=148309 RepID=A0AAD5RA77_PARTN|nr:hypothetical protein KIN20_034752 [Parelaphostrongylus tenuis]
MVGAVLFPRDGRAVDDDDNKQSSSTRSSPPAVIVSRWPFRSRHSLDRSLPPLFWTTNDSHRKSNLGAVLSRKTEGNPSLHACCSHWN